MFTSQRGLSAVSAIPEHMISFLDPASGSASVNAIIDPSGYQHGDTADFMGYQFI